jgi:TonB-linked SusC/RagA family outer membrane protein
MKLIYFGKQMLTRQIWLAMKITIILTMAAFLQVSATCYSQTVTFSGKGVNLKKVFKALESQTGIVFFYDAALLREAKPVTVKFKNVTLETALNDIFKEQPLNWVMENKTITIIKKHLAQTTEKVSTATSALPRFPPAITGKITDEKGQPLEGATLLVKGTQNGTKTDVDGNFALEAQPNSTLIISYVGFGSVEINIGNRTVISVRLKPTTGFAEQVVVVGYGTQRRKDLTGSITTISDNDYKAQPVLNAAAALQGRAAGVAVTNTSGAPGGAFKIRIRGANSINASNDPLYVIDGVALSSIGLQDINVNDIESMEVLKDASATAIYGSRGANGVVLITTKSGRAGIAKIEYNSFVSKSKPMKKYDLLNAVDYAKQANHIAGGNVFADPSAFAGKTTNWQDLIFSKGITQNHQLSVSGGTEKSRYYISVYYVDQSGLLVNSSQKKFAIRSNIDTRINDKLSLGLGLFAARTNSHNNGDIGGKINPVTGALTWAPTESVYDSNGKYNRFAVSPIAPNPYMTIKERQIDNFSNSAVLNGKLKYRFTDYLTLNVNVGLDLNTSKSASLYNDWISPGNPGSGQGLNESYTIQNSNALTFHKRIRDDHDLTVTGIVEETSSKNSYFYASGSGLTSLSNGYNNLGLNATSGIGSGYSNWAILSYIGRLSYSFKEKYLLTATYRADGSSKFQKSSQWGYFPSVGLGWRMSEEKFIKDLNLFSNLKLRGSWGITGNQSINPYSSLGLLTPIQYSFGSTALSQGYLLGSPSNPDLKWETTAQTDIGVDMSFINNRINVTMDFYKKRTKDLLLQVPIPGYSGGGSVYQNTGVIDNKGFEFAVDVVAVETKNFSWTTSFNASSTSNKVISLGKDSIIYRPVVIGGGGLVSTIQVAKTGEALGAFYLIPWSGIYQSDANGYKAGDNNYTDVSKNGSIGFEDRVIIGNSLPKFIWAWNNNFNYKNLELNLFIQAVQGNKVFNATYAAIAAPTSDIKYPTLAESANYWTSKNTGSLWADPASATNRSYVESSQYLQDGSYIRLKNISLSYSFPKKLTHLENVKLSVSAQNLATITKYKGFDPEASSTSASSDADGGIDLGAYPSPKIITVGLHIEF